MPPMFTLSSGSVHEVWLRLTTHVLQWRGTGVLTAERFLVSGQQVHFAAGWRLIRMIAHVAALGLVLARKTFAFQEFLVRLAWHGRERAAGRHAVREELVRPPVVAQAPAVHLGSR